MTINEYFGDWAKVLDLQETNKILKEITKNKNNIYPLPANIFKAFRKCSFHNLRVVIIGDRPYSKYYNNKPIATGIAFGVDKDNLKNNFIPSLEILKESVIDYSIPHETINFDTSLEKWEEQGVLLLNMTLSCGLKNTNIHALIWRKYIINFLTNLSKCSTGIVYVLMGKQAQQMTNFINDKFNHIICCNLPSYYAETNTKMPSYIWQNINQILIGQNGYGIKW